MGWVLAFLLGMAGGYTTLVLWELYAEQRRQARLWARAQVDLRRHDAVPPHEKPTVNKLHGGRVDWDSVGE